VAELGADPMAEESALLVPVPEAEPLVRRWRERLDRSAAMGVPAHVTILYPFVPPGEVDDRLLVDLRSLFGEVAPFDYALTDLRWFGEDVLWLAPAPDTGFRRLIDAIVARYPRYPPYGRPEQEVVPHLTVGDSGGQDALRAAEAALQRRLPVPASARQVWLVEATETERWRVRERFALGAG
jgi:2'-5' RNA ligase